LDDVARHWTRVSGIGASAHTPLERLRAMMSPNTAALVAVDFPPDSDKHPVNSRSMAVVPIGNISPDV
jgi:hypothetical protein